ncbi:MULTISPECIES: hypothetical protein [unclassified Methanosarcina]|uniref:hypothetical protein n=1 Tax=unclassified Methanosarcina TaxID=2644672 RepID=UPI0012DFFB73|nr:MULTISPECIES: hypothetical protein [unclassified Methanosarcina]
MGDRFPEKALSITEIKKVMSVNPEQEPEAASLKAFQARYKKFMILSCPGG